MVEKLDFETGDMTKKETEAVFDALPVDITYVSKEKKVQFFNRLGKRIFPRTKEVIWKKVEKCHPKKSLEKVMEVIKRLESGESECEEFWINARGSLVYIRYFAVRNRQGNYLGCLEVSQDITKIKKISGEKRLLDQSKVRTSEGPKD